MYGLNFQKFWMLKIFREIYLTLTSTINLSQYGFGNTDERVTAYFK